MNVSFETIMLGLKSLRLHALRSVLTSLGIILGVASVIVMVSIGEGNNKALYVQFNLWEQQTLLHDHSVLLNPNNSVRKEGLSLQNLE